MVRQIVQVLQVRHKIVVYLALPWPCRPPHAREAGLGLLDEVLREILEEERGTLLGCLGDGIRPRSLSFLWRESWW